MWGHTDDNALWWVEELNNTVQSHYTINQKKQNIFEILLKIKESEIVTEMSREMRNDCNMLQLSTLWHQVRPMQTSQSHWKLSFLLSNISEKHRNMFLSF